MSFVRIKKIKGKEYAYLVENTWDKGKVRQKTLKYLGKINKFKTKKIDEFEENNPLQSILKNTLLSAGFNEELKNNKLYVNLNKKKVFFNNKEATIKLNDGFLSSNNLKKLLMYTAGEETTPGLKLAKILDETGINITKECFIRLYRVLHAN